MKRFENLDIIIPISLDLDWPKPEEVVRDILEQYENYGFTRFILACPCGGWRSIGYPPTEFFAERAEMFKQVRDALLPYGIECGWWITTTVKSGVRPAAPWTWTPPKFPSAPWSRGARTRTVTAPWRLARPWQVPTIPLYNYRRQRLIHGLIREYCDEIVYLPETPRVFTLMNDAVDKKAAGFKHLLTLINLSPDTLETVDIHIPAPWLDARNIQILNEAGEWAPLDGSVSEHVIIPKPLSYLEPMYLKFI